MTTANRILSAFGRPILLKQARMVAGEKTPRNLVVHFGGIKILFPKRRPNYARLDVAIYGDQLVLQTDGRVSASLQINSDRYLLKDGQAVQIEGQAVRFFNDQQMMVSAADLFPEVFSIKRGPLSCNSRHDFGHFRYGSLKFVAPLMSCPALAEAVKDHKIFFEIHPQRVILLKGEVELGRIELDAEGFLLLEGKRYLRRNQPVSVRSPKIITVNLADFIPAFAEHERKISLVKMGERDVPLAFFERIRFRFNLDRRNPYRKEILSGRIVLRVRSKQLIDIVQKSENGFGDRVIDSIYFSPGGYLLRTLANGHQVIHSRKVRQGRPAQVNVTEICPKLAILQGPVRYIPGRKRASFELDNIEYHFPMHPNSWTRRLIDGGHLFWRRTSKNQILIFEKSKGQMHGLGLINFDADGCLLKNGDLYTQNGQVVQRRSPRTGRRMPLVNIVELIPSLGAMEKTICYHPGLRRAETTIHGIHFYLPTDPSYIIFLDLIAGRLRVRYSRERIEFFRVYGQETETLVVLPPKLKGRSFSLGEHFPWIKTKMSELLGFFAEADYEKLRLWVQQVEDLNELSFKVTEYFLGNEQISDEVEVAKGFFVIGLAADRIAHTADLRPTEKQQRLENLLAFMRRYIRFIRRKGLLNRYLDIFAECIQTIKIRLSEIQDSKSR
jgi:hypothetical protein